MLWFNLLAKFIVISTVSYECFELYHSCFDPIFHLQADMRGERQIVYDEVMDSILSLIDCVFSRRHFIELK